MQTKAWQLTTHDMIRCFMFMLTDNRRTAGRKTGNHNAFPVYCWRRHKHETPYHMAERILILLQQSVTIHHVPAHTCWKTPTLLHCQWCSEGVAPTPPSQFVKIKMFSTQRIDWDDEVNNMNCVTAFYRYTV